MNFIQDMSTLQIVKSLASISIYALLTAYIFFKPIDGLIATTALLIFGMSSVLVLGVSPQWNWIAVLASLIILAKSLSKIAEKLETLAPQTSTDAPDTKPPSYPAGQ
ncbi:MAG: hypothetical protein J0H01_33935 [Rhizobiales bacterium]|nr:hypothetical protein [Hyphomicrobiales bacterium]